MGMNLIELVFEIYLDNDEVLQVMNLRELVRLVQKALGSAEEEGVATEETNGSPDLLDHQPPTTSHLETNGAPSLHNPSSSGVLNEKSNDSSAVKAQKIEISSDSIVECFNHVKLQIDDFIAENGLSGYMDTILPLSGEPCIIHILDASRNRAVQSATFITHYPSSASLNT